MTPRELVDFLGVVERLKGNTRHSWTSNGSHETVAAHSWRLATMAMLMRAEMPDVDMDRVVQMCLVHDFGEAITGDIPAFEKSDRDERRETSVVVEMIASLAEPQRTQLQSLFAEMDAMQTPEARLYKALDKLEAVMQHNEAPLDTWLPLEYDLQRTYGVPEAAAFPYVEALRKVVLDDTERKIKDGQ